MPKKVTTQSPKLYLGMDIHKKTWKIHFSTDISSGAGKTFPPEAAVLRNYVNLQYPDHSVSVAYEAGCCGYAHARSFIEYGWDTFVVNPADIPKPAKIGVVKTDKIDAHNIAKQLRAGNLIKIAIPDVDRECLRSLTRHRSALVKDLRRIKNRIKSLLLNYDVKIPDHLDNPNWSKEFIGWLKTLKWNYLTVDLTLKSMLKYRDFLQRLMLDISIKIRAHCRKHHKKDYTLLRSVPGIGPLTAAYILAEIGDLRRFPSFKKFASYIGIVPGVHSSGESHRATGVTPIANRTIRSLIVESSWVAIRIDPVLQNYYREFSRLSKQIRNIKLDSFRSHLFNSSPIRKGKEL